MKKSTKLGLLASAILVLGGSMMLSTTNAATNTATLKINTGSNTCTWADYDFGSYNVSVTDTTLNETSKTLTCVLLDNAAKNIQVSIGNLSNGTNTISGSNFEVSTIAGTVNGTLINDQLESYGAFNTGRTIYPKAANTAGQLTITNGVKIKGTIPGGTPSGTYTGDLDVTF